MNLPVQLFEGNRDLEVVSQHVEGREDVGPLNHLPQRTPLEHFGTEDIPRLLRQKANVNEDLNTERNQVRNVGWGGWVLLLRQSSNITASFLSNDLSVRPQTAEILQEQFSPDCQNSCMNGPR